MPEHQQIHQSKKPDTIFQKQTTPISQTPISNSYSIIQRAKINPKSLTHADIMQLQRTIGNQAVGRLLSSIGNTSTAQQATVQRQDILEEEEKPMQGKSENVQRSETPEEEEPLQGKMAGTVQRQEIPEEEEPLQGKMIETVQRQEIPEEEEPLQGKFEDKPEIACPSCFAAPIVQRQEIPEEEEPLQGKMIETVQRQKISEEEEPLQIKRENNTGMPDNLKAGMENLSGIDISDVRVHYNSSKPAEVGALAYTQGTNIHVAPGQEKHLPHEAWHAVQQAQDRVKPTFQMKEGMAVNDDKELEQEATLMGERASMNDYIKEINKKESNFLNEGACREHLSFNEKTIQKMRFDANGNVLPANAAPYAYDSSDFDTMLDNDIVTTLNNMPPQTFANVYFAMRAHQPRTLGENRALYLIITHQSLRQIVPTAPGPAPGEVIPPRIVPIE